MLHAHRQISIRRVLAFKFDLEAYVVDRIGIAQGIFVADFTGFMQIEQRLVERLHTQFARSGYDFLDLVYVPFEYEV